jgi:hypothetical protein
MYPNPNIENRALQEMPLNSVNEKQNRNGGANFGRSYNGGSLDKDIRGRRRNNAHN